MLLGATIWFVQSSHFDLLLHYHEVDNNTEALTTPIAEPTPQSTTWSLVSLGDIMLSRHVEKKMLAQPTLFEYPYLKMKDHLSADIVFGNLETPLVDGPPVPAGKMVFRADTRNASALKKYGFNVLSLANNHALDAGQKGLTNTIELLEQTGIYFCGAGRDQQEAYAHKTISIGKFKVAFLAYNDNDVVPPYTEAGVNASGQPRPGTAFMQGADLVQAIALARQESDFVIISMHSGHEYKALPNNRQVAFAREAIDLGADLVIGHHPHVVQTAEVYKDKYIFYSLGNFIFDQMFSNETRRGLLLKINLSDNKIDTIQLVPTVIEDYVQPRLALEAEATWILDRLALPYIQNTKGYFLELN